MAFFILGLISLAIGAANFCFSREPRSFDRRLPSGANKKGLGGWAAAKAALLDVKSVVVVPTFAIIIVQVQLTGRARALPLFWLPQRQ